MQSFHPRTRRRYDTSISLLYILQKEHLLPETFRRSIPSSTSSGWRNEKQENFYGNEHRKITDEGLEWAELVFERDHLKKTLRTIACLWIACSHLLLNEKQNQREFRSKIISIIRNYEQLLPRKLLLNIFNIPSGAYNYFRYAGNCSKSFFRICLTQHSSQLTSPEVKKMKWLLTDQRFIC